MFQSRGFAVHVLTALTVLTLANTAEAASRRCMELFKSAAESAAMPTTPAPAFAGEIMSQILKTQSGNVVIPTASVHSVLTMAALAAGEKTPSRAELSRALNLPELDSQTLAENYGQMLSQMRADGDGVNSPIVRMVNAIFVNPTMTISPHYAQAMRDQFAASIVPATPADLARVNDVVKEVTKGKVVKVLDGLNPNMRAVLVSASYVEAAWKKSFKTGRPAPFHPSGKPSSDSYDVNTLSAVSDVFGTAQTAQAQIVELPFKDPASAGGKSSRFSAVLLVPKDGHTVQEVLATSDQALSTALQGKENVMTSLQTPKFSFEWSGDLVAPLRAMGVRGPFERSDFTNLTENADGIYVSQVRSAAFLDFNETGFAGGGAAAVEFSFRGMGPRVEKSVTVDRPFVLVIRDNLLEKSLLTAAVMRPNAASGTGTTATVQVTSSGTTQPAPVTRGTRGGWR